MPFLDRSIRFREKRNEIWRLMVGLRNVERSNDLEEFMLSTSYRRLNRQKEIKQSLTLGYEAHVIRSARMVAFNQSQYRSAQLVPMMRYLHIRQAFICNKLQNVPGFRYVCHIRILSLEEYPAPSRGHQSISDSPPICCLFDLSDHPHSSRVRTFLSGPAPQRVRRPLKDCPTLQG